MTKPKSYTTKRRLFFAGIALAFLIGFLVFIAWNVWVVG